MTPSGQTVCLCMIVKNEAPVIRRCLDSVRPLVDRWIVVDTGSTDGTQEIVREHLRGLPGELVERPWQDFAHNRSEALALARPHGDYALIVDADDLFEVPAGFRLPELAADSYVVDIRDGGIAYQRTQLVRNALPWRYRGVLHEFLACEAAETSGHLPLVMVRNHDGARRRDPDTYRKDAAILEGALATETDAFLRSRYTFYLAQSYRDCGEREKALEHYLARAELGYWDEEVYCSLLYAGRLMEGLNRSDEEILRTYARASAACPSRAEAAHAASSRLRNRREFARGAEIARAASGLRAPAGGLFVEDWIYTFGILDEFSVNAYWAGRYRDCADACETILSRGDVPDDVRKRIGANLRFASEKLEGVAASRPSPAAAGWIPTRPQGGTELMVEGLRQRLGPELEAIDLRVNQYDWASRDARPLVVWFHHDVDQAAVQWCGDTALVAGASAFVFVSHWQRERYVARFGLPPERCVVIGNALEPAAAPRLWHPSPILRCAYTSTPFRGLDVLLDVWDKLPAGRAELHVWSSMRLYAQDDGPYRNLIDRARGTRGVTYHGLAPNADLRAALRTMHFLTYPSTFAETSCLAAMEAMEAGCRVIVPAFGALPETTGGYAHVYPWSAGKAQHAASFEAALRQELDHPWGGRPEDALAQQTHCRATLAWDRRIGEWRRLLVSLGRATAPRSGATPARLATAAVSTNAAEAGPASRSAPAIGTRPWTYGSTLLPPRRPDVVTRTAPHARPEGSSRMSPSAEAPAPPSALEDFDRRHPVTMEPDEISYLAARIAEAPDDALLVEWGSGASTLRWIREMRGSQRLISVEHNPEWYQRVRKVLDSEPELARRVRYHLCPPNGYVDHGYGQPAEENPVGLDDYFTADPELYDADLFLIDGVARGVCAMLVHARATKPGALIYIHDWHPRRLWYSWAVRLYGSCERVGSTLCKLSR